jgi:hypothetical protein
MKTLIAVSLLLALTSSAAAITPYQEGMRDYRAGQCFRARPYIDDSPKEKLWIKGYEAQQRKEHNKRDWSHCFPGR